MAINLKPVDVAVVGLGAAGGVAVLPLCRAGLKVAGIEAGTWMDPHKDFKADEIHNNTRGMITTGNKIRREAPTVRNSPTGRARRGGPSPMMNAVGGHVDPLSRAELAAEAVGFQDRHRSDQALRQELHSPGFDGGGLAHRLRRAGAVLRHRGDRSRRLGQGRQHSEARSIRRAISSKGRGSASIRCRISAPAIIWSIMKKAARSLGWNPFHSPAAINSVPYNGHGACGYHGYCDRGGCHLQAKNSTCFSTIPKAQATKNLTVFDRAQVTRIVADANGKVRRSLVHLRWPGIFSARQGRPGRAPTLTRTCACCCFRNPRRIRTGSATTRGRWASITLDTGTSHPERALFPMDLNVWYGALSGAGRDDR